MTLTTVIFPAAAQGVTASYRQLVSNLHKSGKIGGGKDTSSNCRKSQYYLSVLLFLFRFAVLCVREFCWIANANYSQAVIWFLDDHDNKKSAEHISFDSKIGIIQRNAKLLHCETGNNFGVCNLPACYLDTYDGLMLLIIPSILEWCQNAEQSRH